MKSELDKKKLIIKFAKKLNSTNLSPLRSGNISIRHTKNKEDGFLITPSGMKNDELKVSDIVFVSLRVKYDAASTAATYSDGTDLGEAVGMAKAADVAVVFVATLSHEGGDRTSLSLDDGCEPDTRPGHTGVGHPCEGNNHNQNAMVSAIVKANPNTVVVMSVPGAVLSPSLSPSLPLSLSLSRDRSIDRSTSFPNNLSLSLSLWQCRRRRFLGSEYLCSTWP